MGASVRPRPATPNGNAMGPYIKNGTVFDFLPPSWRGRALDYFTYTSEFNPLVAGTTQQSDVPIQADADFCILQITKSVTNTDNVTFVGKLPALLTLFDAGSGRQLMDRPVHIENMSGDAAQPYGLFVPKIIGAGSLLTVRLQSLDTNNRVVRLTFHGMKAFAYPPGGEG